MRGGVFVLGGGLAGGFKPEGRNVCARKGVGDLGREEGRGGYARREDLWEFVLGGGLEKENWRGDGGDFVPKGGEGIWANRRDLC